MKLLMIILLTIISLLGHNSFEQAQSVPFITNRGECHESVEFYTRTFSGIVSVISDCELLYALSEINDRKGIIIKEKFVGGKSNDIKGEGASIIKVSNLKPEISKQKNNGSEVYDFLNLGEIYEGINVKLKAKQNNIEKLFLVDPGSDPEKICMEIEGADKIEINEQGELELFTKLGSVKFTSPVAYQKDRPVSIEYFVEGNRYGFKLGDYDPEKTLVIDPLLSSTFVGGSSTDDDYEPAIAEDSNGNIFITGFTYSTDFPVTPGVYESSFEGGSTDRFVSKFNSDLTELISSTFIGGKGNELGMGIAVDDENNIFISGYTSSGDFPIVRGSYDETFNGLQDVYIAKLNNDLTELLASTYLGGSGMEGQTWPRIDMTLDSQGNVVIAGLTRSTDFPVSTNAFDNSFNGGSTGGDPFLAKFNPELTELIASTYLGGSGEEWRLSVLADEEGSVFICGETESSNYPVTAGAYDNTFNGWSDIFISKLNSDFSQMSASTYFGKSNAEEALAMALDPVKGIYICGYTKSADFPTTAGAFDKSFTGEREAYVANFNLDLSDLQASTFLGGNSRDDARDMVFDEAGYLYVTGNTSSTDFPVTLNAFDESINSNHPNADLFITKIDADLNQIYKSTFFGGSADESSYDLLINQENDLLICGITTSFNFPTVNGSYDESYNNGGDCFIIKIDTSLSKSYLSISNDADFLPESFILKQNYPNPFNPSTAISFTLPVSGEIKMTVHNLGGQEIVQLVEGYYPAGTHSVKFDASGLTSGVYLYSLKAGEFYKSKKMIVLK